MKLGVSERLAIACGITSTKSRRLEAKGLVEVQKQKGLTFIALGNEYLASKV